MTMEADLFAALKTLVGNRVTPVVFPQPPAVPVWPAIRYTIIASVPETDLCGDGDDDTAAVRLQLDLVASTFKDVRALRLQVMAAMAAFHMDSSTGMQTTVLEDSISEYDADTKTYREVLDYSLNGSSPSSNSPP